MHDADATSSPSLLPRRKELRLKGFDYRSRALYFLTICIQRPGPALAAISDGHSRLTPQGRLVEHHLLRIPKKFEDAEIDVFVVMPDHVHAVFELCDSCDARRASLADIVAWFKTVTTVAYCRRVKNDGWSPIDGQLWQRGYHDRIVRSRRELDEIRRYIHDNPRRWTERHL